MCHDYEFEMLKRANFEQLARRDRAKTDAAKKPEEAPEEPATTPARVRDKEPVPA